MGSIWRPFVTNSAKKIQKSAGKTKRGNWKKGLVKRWGDSSQNVGTKALPILGNPKGNKWKQKAVQKWEESVKHQISPKALMKPGKF